MPGCALGQCRTSSLERATELESRLFLTEKESTNMQQLQIKILFSTISLSEFSTEIIFSVSHRIRHSDLMCRFSQSLFKWIAHRTKWKLAHL